MRELKWAPGSIGAVDYVLADGEPALTANERVVYLALFSRMGKTFTCYPKVLTIAAGTGLSERTVQRTLKDLAAIGLVLMEPRYDAEGRQTSTLFRLRPPWEVIRLVVEDQAEGDSVTPLGDKESPAPAKLAPIGRQEVTLPVTESHPEGDRVTPEVTHLSNPMKKPNEEDGGVRRQHDEQTHAAPYRSWREWYEKKTGGLLPRNQYSDVLDNAVGAGMDAEVVILAIQRCLDEKKRVPLSAAATLVGNWLAAGVLTVEAMKDQEVTNGEHTGNRSGDGQGPVDRQTAADGTQRRRDPARITDFRRGRPVPDLGYDELSG